MKKYQLTVRRSYKTLSEMPCAQQYRRIILMSAVMLVLLAGNVGFGQEFECPPVSSESSDDSIPGLICHLKSNPANLSIILKLASKADSRAITPLRDAFASVSQKPERQWIAVALVKSGDSSGDPIEYLIEEAAPLVDTEAPTPFDFDADGRIRPGSINPEFKSWCERNGMDSARAAHEYLYDAQKNLRFLEYTGSLSTVPFLKRALAAPNVVTAANAARALVAILGEDAVDLVDQRCMRLPLDGARAVAIALVPLSSGKAQKVLERYKVKVQE